MTSCASGIAALRRKNRAPGKGPKVTDSNAMSHARTREDLRLHPLLDPGSLPTGSIPGAAHEATT
jgi:hypothetical protein